MKSQKLLVIVTSVIAALATVGGAVFAATVFNKTLNASVNIVGNANLSYYSDDDAEHQITQITLGDVSQGATKTFDVWVKNTSSVTENVTAGTHTLPSGVGTLTLTFDGATQKTLAPGVISHMVVTFVAGSGATLGTTSFTLSVDAVPVASSTTTPPSTGTTVSFSGVIQPILTSKGCTGCHSWAGSYSGVAGKVVPGNASGSTLYQRVSSGSMPAGGTPLSSAQIQSVGDWINQGASNN